MSDIKNEIDRIKQDIQDVGELPWQYRELHRTIEYDAIQDASGKNIICISSYDQANVDFLLLAINNISSLITTIESQKEEIEKQLEQFIGVLDEAHCRGEHILSVSSYLKSQIEKFQKQLSLLQEGDKHE